MAKFSLNEYCVSFMVAMFVVCNGYKTDPLGSSVLQNQIRYYEMANFSSSSYTTQQIQTSSVIITLYAFNRQFVFSLTTDHSVFSADFTLTYGSYSVNVSNEFDKRRLVRGYVVSDTTSYAYGYIHPNGAFQGCFRYNGIRYFIERADLYISGVTSNDYITYKLSDLVVTEDLPTPTPPIDEIRKKKKRSSLKVDDVWDDNVQYQDEIEGSFDYLRVSDEEDTESTYHRTKRNTNTATGNRKGCELFIQVDHTYTELHGSVYAASVATSILLQGVNTIYRSVDFVGDGKADGVSIIAKKLQINTTLDTNAINNPFGQVLAGSVSFILVSASDNRTDYCLFFTLTARNFTGGSLGIAFYDSRPGVSGVCSRYGPFFGSTYSFNAGVVTNLLFQDILAYPRVELVLAHEIGHGFGSDHDPPQNKTCVPGDIQGDYLMVRKLFSGNRPNNDHFSICSKLQIAPFIKYGASEAGCFVSNYVPVCGNGILDAGEECDCGYHNYCNDSCCNPQYAMFQDMPKNGSNGYSYIPCTRKPITACNLTNNPCYNQADKSFYTFQDKRICSAKAECLQDSYCYGNKKGSICPPSVAKADVITSCHFDYNVCINSSCNGSPCLRGGYQPCTCSNTSLSCQLCCYSENNECVPASTISPLSNITKKYLVDGSACSNSKGYCDSKGVCHVAHKPSISFGQSYLSVSATLEELVGRWFTRYYWVIIIIVGLYFTFLIGFFLIRNRRYQRLPFNKKRLSEDKLRLTNSPSTITQITVF